MILTNDPKVKNLLEIAESIAGSRAAVMICGESGSGKKTLAKYIHSKSQRANQKLVSVNCAALPGGLLESELFGYVKGAFSGANQDRIGKLELAHNSTLLLEGLEEIPLLLQAKLLKVLQEGEVERIGSIEARKVNIRIISTTSRKLEKMVKDGSFREDLYYRLNVVPLEIPALRERKGDIVLLARHFVEVSCILNNKEKKTLTEKAISRLTECSWPGNIRELENVLERSVLLSSGTGIGPESLSMPKEQEEDVSSLEPGMTVSEAERKLILKTLSFTKQNRTKAAKLLGISIRTLRNKIHEYKGENYL